jgi:hypothetical protein
VTNDGGQTYFNDHSTGGTAQFITVGTGFVDFSGSLGPNGDGRIAAARSRAPASIISAPATRWWSAAITSRPSSKA